MSEDNPQILAYKRLAEQVTGRKIVFEQIGAGQPMRGFLRKKRATVIRIPVRARGCMPTANMWSGSLVEELARIQIEYLKSLANA